MAGPVPARRADAQNIMEKRRLRRKQTRLNGRLVYGGESFHADCIIRDLNENGARVSVVDPNSLPDSVTLVDPNSLMAYDATTKWRYGNLIGLSFDRAFSVDNDEAVRVYILRQMALELRDQSTVDAANQSVTGP